MAADSAAKALQCPFACACVPCMDIKPVKFDGKATVGIASGQPAEDGDPQAEKDPCCSDHSHCNPEILPVADREREREREKGL